MKIRSFISSLFVVKKCFWCQKSGHFFCPQCYNKLYIYSPQCYFCKKISQNFSVHNDCQIHFPIEQIIVLTRYRQSGVKRLLRHAKYYGKYKAYEDIIFPHKDFFIQNINRDNAVLVPVPMNLFRKWKRGYNQSDHIASILWKILNIPVDTSLLSRKKHTKQQSHLSREERLENLKNAFKLNKNKYPKNTLFYLVDDIVSTGATLTEISKILKLAGFSRIKAITLASD